MATIRLLHYDEERKSDLDEGIFGCGAHTDWGVMTLLLTDEHSGLQIYNRNEKNGDGEWIDVPPRSDAFVVNIGDLLERWTNGKMKSTLHRVLLFADDNEKDKEEENDEVAGRYSIPFFFNPSFETVVECLDVCIDERTNNLPLYPPTTTGEYLIGKFVAHCSDYAPTKSEDENGGANADKAENELLLTTAQ